MSFTNNIIPSTLWLLLLDSVSKPTYAVRRQRIAFIILFYTGMRVGLLKKITVGSMLALLNSDMPNFFHSNQEKKMPETIIKLITILKQPINLVALNVLMQDKVTTDPLFTTKKKKLNQFTEQR